MQACLQEDFWPLDPPKTWVSSHFSKKNERITNAFEDCESAKHVAIWYQRGQKVRKPMQACLQEDFCPQHLVWCKYQKNKLRRNEAIRLHHWIQKLYIFMSIIKHIGKVVIFYSRKDSLCAEDMISTYLQSEIRGIFRNNSERPQEFALGICINLCYTNGIVRKKRVIICQDLKMS